MLLPNQINNFGREGFGRKGVYDNDPLGQGPVEAL